MIYTYFRYIAYEVPTIVEDLDGVGKECPSIAKIPVANSLPKDARIRLKRLAAVVSLAKEHVTRLGDDANTLKIFMAPEFYFRPPAAEGEDYLYNSYPLSDYRLIINELGKMFRDPDFTDWLIIPGTVMMNTKIPIEQGKLTPVYFNSSFIIRGGPVPQDQIGSNLNYIEKKLPSNSDGVPETSAPGQVDFIKEVFEDWANRKKHVLDISGVRLGLEICLDHYNRVLKQVLGDWHLIEGRDPEPIQLHLLTACGMDVKAKWVAAKVNGYILRNDGFVDNSEHSELWKVSGYTCIDANLRDIFDPILTPWDPLGKALIDRVDRRTAEIVSLTGAQQVPMKNQQFKQQLAIYPAIGLL